MQSKTYGKSTHYYLANGREERTTWYLVEWKRFRDEHNTWEKRKDIGTELITEDEGGYEGNDFAIERLFAKQTCLKRTEYLVEWKGQRGETTWEKATDVSSGRIMELEGST